MKIKTDEKQKIRRGEKGITLIALVVTIVVLLILAGVSLNLVIGNNGIITKTKEAKTEMRGAQVEDLVELYKSDNELSEYSITEAQTEEELLQDLKNRKLVENDEIDTENKTITIGTKVISYALPEKQIDRTALKFLVNSGNDGVVVLPVSEDEYGEDGYEVDWGDGTTGRDETVVATKETELASLYGVKLAATIVYPDGLPHTYPEKNKEYVVTITGICEDIYSFYKNTTRDKIIEVLQWGETGLNSIILGDCENLRNIASPTENSFSDVSSFFETFRGCTNLTSIPSDLFANCTSVKDFSNTFTNCSGLTGNAPELWNMVTDGETNDYIGTPDGEGCFAGCNNLTNYEQIPEYWKMETK